MDMWWKVSPFTSHVMRLNKNGNYFTLDMLFTKLVYFRWKCASQMLQCFSKLEIALPWLRKHTVELSHLLRGDRGMKSRDLSKGILISSCVSLFEITGTVPNTHEASDDRTASVASNQRISIPHGNPFPGTIGPSVSPFSLTVKCGNCVDICRQLV